MSLLVKELINPNFGLFETNSNGTTLKPNPNSKFIPDHLTYFKLVGRLIGKIIYDQKNLELCLAGYIMKLILGMLI